MGATKAVSVSAIAIASAIDADAAREFSELLDAVENGDHPGDPRQRSDRGRST